MTNFQSASEVKYTATFTPSNYGASTLNVKADVFTDTLGNKNIASEVFSWFFDNASPVIGSVALAADNGSINISFSEPVFNTTSGSGALEVSDFALSLTGGTATLTSATPTAITQSGNTYTLSFSLSGTPDGSEVISVAPLANSIYDGSGNLASTTQSNGSGTLFDQTKPVISAINFSDDNSYVELNSA